MQDTTYIDPTVYESIETRRSAQIAMWIEGAKQGKFKGQSPKKEHKDGTDLWTVEYGAQSPRDEHTGLSIGRRQHSPVTVYGEVDGSYINMLTAIYTNETLKTVDIQLWRPDTATATGQGVSGAHKFLEIKLTNANFGLVQQFYDNRGRSHFVARMAFQKIEVTWVKGNLTAIDDWVGSQA